MVIRVIVAAFLALVPVMAPAAGACSKGSEFEPPLCPLALPAIDKLNIAENAAKSAAAKDPAASCADFRVTERQVKRFLALAKTTNANDAHHTLDWSPCYAAGSLQFKDGRSATWRVDQYRSGTLIVGDTPELVLYCPRCRFKPFVW